MNVKTRTLQKPKSAAPPKAKFSLGWCGRVRHPPSRKCTNDWTSVRLPLPRGRVRHPPRFFRALVVDKLRSLLGGRADNVI